MTTVTYPDIKMSIRTVYDTAFHYELPKMKDSGLWESAPLRFYVAGKWEEREEVKKIQQALKRKGHRITCDWTTHVVTDKGFPVQYAMDDITGVESADAYVGLFINPNSYKGALVEMGVALSRCEDVYIIGHAIDSCIFIHHPIVQQFESVEEFLKEIPNA